VMSITIQPDTSGLTQSLVPSTRLARGVVASAGYLGAAMVGCLLMAATRVEKWAHVILLGVGVCMLVTVLLWMRNLFGVAAVIAWGVTLIAMARRRRMANAVTFLFSLLAIQVALNSVYDIRVLFLIEGGPSDAATMARLFLAPAWMWATLWMVISIAMLCATIWSTRGRGANGFGRLGRS
jgi:peptidase M50B-like protein